MDEQLESRNGQWHEDLAQIEAQHRDLQDGTRLFLGLLEAGRPPAELSRVLAGLVQRLEVHFRTEELLISVRYYGLDNQYFTTLLDYGFSKRIVEAFEKWGLDAVMRDVVRLIRMDRPYILLSRFQGNQRDGHGNHQTAGLITTLAFKAAGDPNMYPEQIKEGLRPWQPHKVYIGGVRENEAWNVKIDAGEFHFGTGAPERIEYASLYSPYWQARLAEPTAAQRVAAAAYAR